MNTEATGREHTNSTLIVRILYSMSARSLINIVVFPFSAYVQLLYEWLNGGLVRFCP